MFRSQYNSYGNYPPPLMQVPLPPVERPMQVSCGGLREHHHGLLVELFGRVVKQSLGRFLVLRDSTGQTQLIANNEDTNVSIRFQKMPVDSQLRVVGRCRLRPESSRNRTTATGDVEVHVEEILSVKTPYSTPAMKDVGQKRAMSTTSRSCLGITAPELARAKGSIREYFNKRKNTCGELRMDHVGMQIRLVGWLDNSQRFGRFFRLRDGTGYCQVTVETGKTNIQDALGELKESDIIYVEGTVTARPFNSRNSKSETGDVEVIVDNYKLLNPEEPYVAPAFESADDTMEDAELLMDSQNGDAEKKPEIEKLGIEKADIEKSSSPNTSLFTNRTHNCGELNASHVGQNVVICGWLGFQRMKKFITLRDGYGMTQVLIPLPKVDDVPLDSLAFESIMKVSGVVTARPAHMVNHQMATGEIEVMLESFELLNASKKQLPMDVRDFNRAKETLRLEHRYIDLRFVDMQRNLRTRSAVLMKMREYLINQCGFVEVETPTLFRATPGGAQEFVVPSRKRGHFYSLVQSPQQFKQLLMAGAVDRYFQIARCYRDESTRSDRQPEFTQLDVELSFTDKEKVMELIENVIKYSWPQENAESIQTPFSRMTYEDAMAKYGSDKPDLRFNFQLTDVTDTLKLNETLTSVYSDFASYVIVLKSPNNGFPTLLKDSVAAMIKNLTNTRLFVSKLKEPTIEAWTESGISNALSTEVTKALAENLKLEQGDLIFLGIGQKTKTQELMGRIRSVIIESLQSRKLLSQTGNGGKHFLWIVDFPLFTRNDSDQLVSTHHPFTAPHPDDLDALRKLENLDSIRSQAYDLVINGQEVGGGSIRIHDAALQKFVLEDVLSIKHEHLQHLLMALESGCPPHGGIALGIDRLMAIICNTETIRDVIAFPKGLHGKDHMSQAPIELTPDDLKLYHISVDQEAPEN
ncbi:aspartate--tRNA ligase, mitochondrial [Phlebotomus argentipes]|uniref:aspartate--tRNA ligase, mitochondrial n=1 Tax=Phlebotomus argentipes TaxID=94469 RepID=UPI002893497F|nr:aspartate--tRNA ligase, mitochondrial [Phlebotomus argentipes]